MPTSEWIARGVVDVGRSAVNTAVSLTIQGLDVLDALNENTTSINDLCRNNIV